MSEDDVYICLICFYPIIFRYKPPQVFHLGTAWVCWRKQNEREVKGIEDEERDSVGATTCSIPQTTPLDVRATLLEEMKECYGVFCRTGDAAPLLDLVMAQLDSDGADVVGDLFRYLAIQGSQASRAMVYIIVSISNWQEYVVRLRDQAKRKYREQLGRERQRLAGQTGDR